MIRQVQTWSAPVTLTTERICWFLDRICWFLSGRLHWWSSKWEVEDKQTNNVSIDQIGWIYNVPRATHICKRRLNILSVSSVWQFECFTFSVLPILPVQIVVGIIQAWELHDRSATQRIECAVFIRNTDQDNEHGQIWRKYQLSASGGWSNPGKARFVPDFGHRDWPRLGSLWAYVVWCSW